MALMLRSTAAFARATVTLLLAMLVASAGAVTAYAQQNVPIVRDAEIEALVRDYARPIFKAAGLSKSGIDIILVNDPRFNAFVAGRRMFINTGALLQAETPNEIIGVIAHEAGHIAGGHRDRLREQLARAQTMAVISSLLGVGAMVAGAATDTGGLASAGAGVMAGGTESGAARPARLSAFRGSHGRPVGHQISRGDGPVGQGHACHLRAFPERAVAFRRQGRPLSAKPPDAARPYRQSRNAGEVEPALRQHGFGGVAAASRHDARQDRGVHAGPGSSLAPVQENARQPRRPVWRGAGSTSLRQSEERAEEGRRADQDPAEEPVFL